MAVAPGAGSAVPSMLKTAARAASWTPAVVPVGHGPITDEPNRATSSSGEPAAQAVRTTASTLRDPPTTWSAVLGETLLATRAAAASRSTTGDSIPAFADERATSAAQPGAAALGALVQRHATVMCAAETQRTGPGRRRISMYHVAYHSRQG